MVKKRSPVQVSDEFKTILSNLQKKIRMQTGNDVSFRQLTEEIAKSDVLKDIEKRILEKDIEMDIKIKFDRRFI